MVLQFISYVLLFATALIIVSIGGMFSERSGVSNIALEGFMCISFCISALTLHSIDKYCPGWLVVIIVILTSMIVSLLFSFLFSMPVIKFNADQSLIAISLNLFTSALVVILSKFFSSDSVEEVYFNSENFFIFRKNGFDLNIFTVICIFVVLISWFVMYKLRFGFRLRGCGENPQAIASVNISVSKYRYFGVAISGALSGLGALAYLIPSCGTVWSSSTGVLGFGFLAIAVMIVGSWHPIKICFVAILFSIFMVLGNCYSLLFDIDIKGIGYIFKMLPYLVAIAVLILNKNNVPIKSLGKPYVKESR